MAKSRRTRKKKLAYTLPDLKVAPVRQKVEQVKVEGITADLTKTAILTMLVLALELAIWSYLSRH